MIYLAIIVFISLIVIVKISHTNADKRQEHKNRSEGAKKGWLKRRTTELNVERIKKTVKWIGDNNG